VTQRFGLAMACFAVLGAGAWFTLDGIVRTATLIFLAGMAVKTGLAQLRN
jgi:hypothetical protein